LRRGRWCSIAMSASAWAMSRNSTQQVAFSNRDSLGGEAKALPSSGSRPTTSLCTGSSASRAASLQSA